MKKRKNLIMEENVVHNYEKVFIRLNTILQRLIGGEALSVTKLAIEFKVCERTIQRDINEYLKDLFPLYQDKKRWKIQEEYQLKKDYGLKDLEDIVVIIMLKKLTKVPGEFSKRANKLLSIFIKDLDPNIFDQKSDTSDISNHTSKQFIYENYLKIKRIVTTADNNDILMSEFIKLYITKFSIAHMIHTGNTFRSALVAVKNEKYIVMEATQNTKEYNSTKELVSYGWKLSLKYLELYCKKEEI